MATLPLAADRRHYSMPADQIMAEGGLFLVIEWTIFWQKVAADVAAITRKVCCVWKLSKTNKKIHKG